MRAGLTERQNQVHEYLRSYILDNGRPPTIKEIGAHLAIRSTNGVYKLLVALERKGLIERTPHEARGLKLVGATAPLAAQSDAASIYVPRGSITAHSASRPLPRSRQPVIVDPRLLGTGVPLAECVAVTATDDGLTGAGIRKGDVLVVREMEWSQLPEGCVAAAYVGDRLMVRRYEYRGGRIHLLVADRSYEDQAFPTTAENLYVIGRALALIRRL